MKKTLTGGGGIANIGSILVSPETPQPGEPFELSINIKNEGTLDLLYSELYDSQNNLIHYWEDTVNPGETVVYPVFFPNGLTQSETFTVKAGHVYGSCEDITDPDQCTASGCAWYNNSCHSSWSCGDITNQTDCENFGCYWYNNSCHSYPESTDLCSFIEACGGPSGLTITNVFVVIDSFIYQVPPTDWGFIPTLNETFGVIDYYLGFINSGNTKTGCTFA